ncbi:Hypothetical protein PEIBARAKI_4454 [Petrimonas sp. IBARAKI]|nr:Hypothetical protein PEIBARAKI_4454 [Petrimonas sp. IBARAKI]
MLRKLLKIVDGVSKTNLIKTIYLNFKILPFKQAIKLPIFIYGKIVFRSLKGEININSAVYPGMIKIGKRDYYVETAVPKCIWTINGTINFNGPINFLQGSYILVSNNATLSFGSKEAIIGANIRIMCFEKIVIGNTCRISWDCQIMDTSFHYVENLLDGEIKPLTKPIVIGNNVWIGNRTTISKGAILPDYTIVASNSLVNKDFTSIGENCLIAGLPAKLKQQNIRRIFDNKEQKELDKKHNYVRTHL